MLSNDSDGYYMNHYRQAVIPGLQETSAPGVHLLTHTSKKVSKKHKRTDPKPPQSMAVLGKRLAFVRFL